MNEDKIPNDENVQTDDRHPAPAEAKCLANSIEASEADIALHPKQTRWVIGIMALALIGVLMHDLITATSEHSKKVAEPKAFTHMPFPAKAIKHFKTAVPGLVGWTAEANGQKSIVYSTPNGDYTILGVILGPDGKNLTADDYKTNMPDAVSDAGGSSANGQQALAAQLSLLRGAAMPGLTLAGSVKKEIWVAVDLHCPYCHKLVTNITKELQSSGDEHITIHYVPIAVLGQASAKARGYLERTPEANQMTDLVAWMDGKLGNDATKAFPVKDANQAMKSAQQSMSTGQALQQAGLTAVPDIFWLDNGKVEHLRGLPDDSTLSKLLRG